MNKKTFVIGLFACMTISSYAQKPGGYMSKPFTGLSPKDGVAYLDVMQFDEKSKFMYLLSNDKQNLYIDIILSDRAAIQKTMMFGLTTWVDPEGKKKKTLGIEFPLGGGGGRDMDPQRSRSEGKDRKETMALAMQEKNSRMLLKGFDGKGSEKEINPMTGNGIRGKFEMMEGEKVRVFMTIPLEKIGRDSVNMSAPLSIGFETGYLDLNRSGMAPSGGGNRSGDGGGGFHGGGGPPGGSEGMDRSGGEPQRANLNELATPNRLWIKKVLLSDGE